MRRIEEEEILNGKNDRFLWKMIEKEMKRLEEKE